MKVRQSYQLDAVTAIAYLESGHAVRCDDWEYDTYIFANDEGELIDETGEPVTIEISNLNDIWFLMERTPDEIDP